MSNKKIYWHFYNEEWVQVYEDKGRYYFVDVISYGRDCCYSATLSNIYEGEKPPIKSSSQLIKSEPFQIIIERKTHIKGIEKIKKIIFNDIYFEYEDLERLISNRKTTEIIVTEKITELFGWNNTHVCSYCEESSISIDELANIDLVQCFNCGKIGDFITIETFMEENDVETIPKVGFEKVQSFTGV